MALDLKRIKAFEEWKNNKILVIHMETPMLDVETCLKMSYIPFDTVSYQTENLENRLRVISKEIVGIIITGSRKKGDELPDLPNTVINLGIPVLGMCYGNEWLASMLGSEIVNCNPPFGEHSDVEASLFNSILFKGIEQEETIVTMAHDYMIGKLSDGCKKIASTRLTSIAGFENIKKGIFGLQFHPEKGFLGEIIFKNFFKFCNSYL
jgi:GMP synthase (glutamine-hydrolysing)